MATNYGEARVSIDQYLVGEVRVTSAEVEPAIYTRIRFGLAWTLGMLHRSGTSDPPSEYRLIDYGGELRLGRNGPVVGSLMRPGPRLPLRALPYVSAQQDAVVVELDGARFERLEEYRAGGAVALTMRLWPQIELDGSTAVARIDEMFLSIPREDWLSVVSSVTGGHTELLEIRYHLSHAAQYRESLTELAMARAAVDSGNFDGAVLQARKSVTLLEDAVKAATGGDVATALARRIDERHVKLYTGLIARAKDMGNIKAHRAAAREYSRAEAQFAVRFAAILIEVLAALLTGRGAQTQPSA